METVRIAVFFRAEESSADDRVGLGTDRRERIAQNPCSRHDDRIVVIAVTADGTAGARGIFFVSMAFPSLAGFQWAGVLRQFAYAIVPASPHNDRL